MKTVGGGRKLRYRGIARNRLWVEMTIAGYNLVRLTKPPEANFQRRAPRR